MNVGQHPFTSLVARCFCHATESEEKVVSALRTVVGEQEMRRDVVAGYHGNRIVIFSVKTGLRRHLASFVASVADVWPEISSELDDRLDEDRWLHLRFSKQAAFLGEIELSRESSGGVIDVSLRIRAHPAVKKEAMRSFQRWIGE